MTDVRLGALYSGGKDSSYALYLSLQQGFEVSCLITLRPSSPESYMFHHPNVELTHLQAEAMGIPLISKETEGRKEEELGDLKDALRAAQSEVKIDGMVAGAIDSDYQKTRIDRVADEVGLRSYAPLWRKNPVQLLEEQVAAGFKIIICGVYAHGFDEKWLGRRLDNRTVQDLVDLRRRFGIHPSGEGGEYESLVLDAPLFQQRLRIDEASMKWDADSTSGTYEVLHVHLETKDKL